MPRVRNQLGPSRMYVPTRDNPRVNEPRISIWFGIPTVVIAVVSIVILGSYLVGRALGPSELYTIEQVRAAEFDSRGQSLGDYWHKCYLPSMRFLALLWGNACVAGLGIYLSRTRWNDRPVWMSATGLILSTMAFGMVWILWMQAAT